MTRFTYDWDGDGSILDAVIQALESVHAPESGEPEVLYSAVDPDGLLLVLSSLRQSEPPEGVVEFPFDQHWISVTARGTIDVRPRTDRRPPVVSTGADFRRALRCLLREATTNGVDVGGNWDVSGAEGSPGWNVEIAGVGDDADRDRPPRSTE